MVLAIRYREWVMVPLVLLISASFLLHRPHMFAVFSVILLITLFWNALIKMAEKVMMVIGNNNNSKQNTRFRIHIRNIRADRLVSLFQPVLRISLLEKLQKTAESRIKPYILLSGAAQNPRVLGIRSVLYPVVAAVVIFPVGILLFLMYGPVFLGVLFVPILISGSYFVTLKLRASERKTAIEDEFALFASMASIMESVHVSLYSTFTSIADSTVTGIFPMMRKEGLRIKNISALGKSPTDALMDLADSHPNTSFRNFIEGYISSYNTGGADTSQYLQEQSHRFFGFMQHKMSEYAKQADSIAQIILTVMLLLPMMGLSMMFFASGQTASTMMLLLIVTFPFITVVLAAVIHLRQPKNMNRIRMSWVTFAVSAVVAVLVYVIRGEVWETMGAAVITGTTLNMVFLQKRFAAVSETESALPEFMRQITRFKNIGMDIMGAIYRMRTEIIQRNESKSTKFNHTFDQIIETIYRRMASGSSLEEAVKKTEIKSHNARIIFFILGKVHESGGGTAKTLSDITRWVTQYTDARKEMIASLRASLLTAFIGPVLMVMMMVVSQQLAAEFEQNGSYLADNTAFGIGAVTTADISGLSEILTVTAVVCMGVLLSKINYFTIQHTTFTGIITAVTMILLYAVPYFPEF